MIKTINDTIHKWDIISFEDIKKLNKTSWYSISYIWEYKRVEDWKIFDISEQTADTVNLDMLLDWNEYDFVYGWGLVIVLDIDSSNDNSLSLIPTLYWLECVYKGAY